MSGSIEVICGPMFSGKTSRLIDLARRKAQAKKTSLQFNPKIDTRHPAGRIEDHNTRNIGASTVEDSIEMEVALQNFAASHGGKLTDVIFIDEVQFFDDNVVQIIYDLKCQGVRVVVCGLDMDWMGNPFPVVTTLMGLADKIEKLTAVCTICGEDATYSYLKNKSGDQIQIGASDKYEARCFKHWQE